MTCETDRQTRQREKRKNERKSELEREMYRWTDLHDCKKKDKER
jgi:hypothetical protein